MAFAGRVPKNDGMKQEAIIEQGIYGITASRYLKAALADRLSKLLFSMLITPNYRRNGTSFSTTRWRSDDIRYNQRYLISGISKS